MISKKEYRFCFQNINTKITAISDGILRVTRTLRDNFSEKKSCSVIYGKQIESNFFSADDTCIDNRLPSSSGNTEFGTGNLRVIISGDGIMTFQNAKGDFLFGEPSRRPCTLIPKDIYLNTYDPDNEIHEFSGIDGVRANAASSGTYFDRTAYECRQQFIFSKDEGIYGLGSHEEGYGNLRGKHQLLYQHNMKAVVPVIVSTKGWGILFDMGCMMAFHDDSSGTYLWADCADELDFYVFYGDGSYNSLMERYQRLTGPAPMLPKYALGYIQSKERYVDAAEMLAVAAEYRKRNVPLDMIVLDWQSWPDGQWGFKKFDETRFPDPTNFINALHDMNIKFMISIWPSMQGDHNDDRKEMIAGNFMLGNRTIYNAFNPDARALYWKQAMKLFAHGVNAWWCDCTEPFERDWHGDLKPEPFLRAVMNTDEAKRYIDPAMINLYSLYHSEGIYENQRNENTQKRVCNLTRSSWAGQHRYATITWSGDVSANWETLKRHIPEGLNFCATGEPYWSTDIGAFFTSGQQGPWFYDGDYEEGVNDPGYRELYTRWAQYAAFLPIMRSHGTCTPREIWHFGEKGDLFYDAIAHTIKLRYQFIPYMYCLMAKTHFCGTPMLKIPALVFADDKKLLSIDDQMMLGDHVLIKPVTRPMYYLPNSVKIAILDDSETIYLPSGQIWYDLFSGKCYEGGQNISIHAPIDKIPVFIKGGTILPWGNDVSSTADIPSDELNLMIYPGADANFDIYADEGDGYGYENGEYVIIHATWNDCEEILTLNQIQGSYKNMPKEIHIRIQIWGEEEVNVVYTGNTLQINRVGGR